MIQFLIVQTGFDIKLQNRGYTPACASINMATVKFEQNLPYPYKKDKLAFFGWNNLGIGMVITMLLS